MTIFCLVSFEPGRSITLDSTTALFGRVTTTYVVASTDNDRSRLVVKLEFTAARGRVGSLIRRHVLPAGDLVMMRKQLLTLKKLAERDAVDARGSAHRPGLPIGGIG